MALMRALLLFLLVNTAWAVFTPSRNTYKRHGKISPHCPPHCHCTSEELICNFAPKFNGSSIKVPKNVIKLWFSHWSVKEINGKFFENNANLRWLTLTNGKLVTFPSVTDNDNLMSVDVSDNLITSLESFKFSNISNLRHLDVSGNNLVDISEHFFTGLLKLEDLNLSRNPSLLQIPSNTFSSCCRQLTFLDLSFTGLINTGISIKLTFPLHSLKFLNISHNELTSVPYFHLTSLRIFDVSYNKITVLPKLSGMMNLINLFISHTWIRSLDAQETNGCNKLQTIDVSYTNLTNIDENVLSKCKNFKQIDLSHNDNLSKIKYGALSGLVNLTVLRLNNCPELNGLDEEMFKGLTNLRELYLQDSGIKVLSSSLGELKNLSFVNLEGTHLLCDCHAYWLPTLINSINHLDSWKGVDPIQCQDGSTKTLSQLDLYHQELSCEAVSSNTEDNQWVLAPWDQSALLECNMTGNPEPIIAWMTVYREILVYNKTIMDDVPWINHRIRKILDIATAPTEGRFQVLQTGQLLIRDVIRKDIGRYKCFAFNAVSNSSVVVFLGLKVTEFRHLVLESMMFGFACAALFLFVTLVTQFTMYAMERLGWECCCCRDRMSPKAKQIKQLIESVEAYKSAQLERLKDNYNSQVLGIKDGCYSQMERLRDGYSQQSKNLKELRDYSTQQLTGARDQYLDQVNKCRDYSMSQMNRVRENYVFQRHRIRKFSGHQLVRLRETYKYQQKTLNKLLETLPDLYIQNCRTGSCQRTDSMIFEEEITGLDIYYKVDFRDTYSFNSSDYFYTPCSTLTKQSKNKKKSHTRNESNISGGTEYQEAQSWLHRQESTESNKSILIHKRFHNRSSSLVSTPAGVNSDLSSKVPDETQENCSSTKGHQRSISASINPSPNTHSTKAPFLEDQLDIPPSRAPSLNSSTDASLYTPLSLTPIHDKTIVTIKSDTIQFSEANLDKNDHQEEEKGDLKTVCESIKVNLEESEDQNTAL